jgi:sugar phosphate isomerase/epimerase
VIYASTACVSTKADLWETLEAYRAAGISAVELGAARLDARDRLAERLRDTSLDFAVHNYFPPPAEEFVLNLASSDRGIRSRSVALAREAIELCARIGAPFYSVHAGFVVDPDGWDGRMFTFPAPAPGSVEAATERYAEAYSGLVEAGQAAGVAVLVENNVCTPPVRGKLLLQTAEEFAELCGRVPETSILVDTGHLNVSAHTLGFDPAGFVTALAPAIGAWHLHANDGSADTHDPAAPGWWAIEMLGTAPVVVEARFETVEELADYVAWLAVVAG